MRKWIYPTLLFLVTLLGVLVLNDYANAYNWSTHKNMVEVGVAAMLQTQNIPDSNLPAPPGIDPLSWNDFLAHVRTAPLSLGKLRVGTFRRGTPDSIFPMTNDTCGCQYDPNDNMANVEAYRIMDFHYIPNRSGGVCDLSPANANPSRILGGVLGWHAAMVDDHIDDTVGWIRPLNTGAAAWAKDAFNKWWEYGVGAVLGTLKCIWKWFHGDDCDVMEEGKDLANQTNPVRYIETALPGFGDFRSKDYTGLWHFMDPKAQFPTNVYNDVRGMYYPKAGPYGNPGNMDWLIITATDLTGLSLNADKSDGVDRYGQFDEVSRNLAGDWQGQTFGHLEWSPLQNLGRYGWEVYQGNRMNAYGLGFPLHAIADAVQTQHTASTTSYGHRPLEDAVELNWNSLFPGYTSDPNEAIDLQKDQLMRILLAGFQAWNQLKGGTPFKEFLISIGTDTRNFMDSVASAVYDDYSSYIYQFSANSHYPAVERYNDTLYPYMQPAIEIGIGSMIGFLILASDRVIDPLYDPSVKCPPGTYFQAQTGICITGSLVCNPVTPLPDGLSSLGSTCQSIGQPCGFTIVAGVPLECCQDLDLTCIDNKCVKAGEPTCQGWGEACADSSECCLSLMCTQDRCIPFVK